MLLLGVDIGGTFTDLYLVDNAAKEQTIHKVSTTPNDPSEGALRGIRELIDRTGTDPADIDLVLHGTTIATNAVLEHERARTGMLTTQNHRDITHIGRHQRPQNYSIQQDIPWQSRPLVKRRHRIPVPERMTPEGVVAEPLDEEAVEAAARRLRDDGVESIALCFLFSYVNAEHEQRAKELIHEVHPEAYVSASSEVSPQFREFERFTTTAMNAAIGPLVTAYIERFDEKLSQLGVDVDLRVMQSNGGIATQESVKEAPVMLAYSGPAAGILGGRWRGSVNTPTEEPNIITLDMGGTSADIGIVADGEVIEANVRETSVGGYPVMVPMVDVETIGAGGGSIAYVDAGGAFRVGPQSAGAVPGPACYDRGGERPTVTDAHVALGRIRDDYFLGGAMSLSVDAARAAIDDHLGDPLDLSTTEASLGVLDIVNANMANAIRSKTIQRGHDPTTFTLVAFGGAGPMHAAALARDLDIPRTVIPTHPGVLSAVGLCTTNLQYDFVTTDFRLLDDLDHAALRDGYEALVTDARQQLHRDGFEDDAVHLELVADCRYHGQGYELRVPVDDEGGVVEPDSVRERFDALHEAEFGHHFPENPVELVNKRVIAVGELPSAELVEVARAGRPATDHILTTWEVSFIVNSSSTVYDTPLFDRQSLRAGHGIEGPAIIVETDATVVVPPDFDARVLPYGDIELTLDGGSDD